ncbi:MAG: gamma-glutamyltransferase family protein [Defluviitaleaceae bacterium]|nr:gamma-glutamyltransferase family protein [Defluviitaleaceae bacterium]
MNFNPEYNPYPATRNLHYARRGMVATTQPLAAQAGLDILKRGGNAIDAAIATAAALTVVEPASCGIGGDAFALVWAGGKLHGLNASGKSPKSISIEKIKAMGHERMPTYGVLPATVPGLPAGWAELSRKFGKLSLLEALTPAIGYAREGFPVATLCGKLWGRTFAVSASAFKGEEFAPWFDVYAPNGRAPQVGEMWASAGHGDTLEEIGRTNAESFYKGNLAQKIADFYKKHGGFLTAEDLSEFSPQWVDPISTNYHGYDIWEIPPNGQGIVALIALNILRGYDFAAKDCASTYHRQFEAMKLAFACGKHAVTDPAFMEASVSELLSESFAADLRKKITATAQEPVTHMPPKSGTVYLCTADGDGNMVSFIQSNYMGFGSGIVIPGTGIAMQNRGVDFSLDPAHVNALAPGKKTYHTIIPGFITQGNAPVGPFGVMGGYMQPQGHVQVVMNTVNFGLNPQAALDSPRWQWTSGKTFEIEPHFNNQIAQQLAGMGHKIVPALESTTFGRGQIIWRDPASGVLVGGTESRADGAIAGW